MIAVHALHTHHGLHGEPLVVWWAEEWSHVTWDGPAGGVRGVRERLMQQHNVRTAG